MGISCAQSQDEAMGHVLHRIADDVEWDLTSHVHRNGAMEGEEILLSPQEGR